MYNPQRFKVESLVETLELMDQNPFATVISVADNEPVISHLPLTPNRHGNQIELVGHIAKANPHWKLLPTAHTTAVFHGPHTYITPQWYAEHDVPTWNYSTVHATGSVQLIEDYDGIVSCLKTLTSHVERLWPSGWEFFVPDDLSGETLTTSIVGFKLTVQSFDFKRKLSQNRTPADYARVVKGLEDRKDEASQRVREDMLKLLNE